jgi:choline-sulfatase
MARPRLRPLERGERRWRLSRAFLALSLLATGCARTPPVRPNLLLVTIDTVRADHCSAYGYGFRTTPTLERLAREGALVEKAYAPTATTAPSHASLFTSRYPLEHGVVRNGLVLGQEHVTLTEALRTAGYQTAAFVSSFVLKNRFGLSQGFETYQSKFDTAGQTAATGWWEGVEVKTGFDRRADATTDLALAWLDRRGGERPFFLWVHYFDPHHPYSPPPPYDRQFPQSDREVAAYDGEIGFADAQLGRLLTALEAKGQLARTLVVVTSDHGEGLMQHGYMRHGLQIYEEAVRVPLVARWPGRVPAGRRIPGPVELVDLAPTLLQLLGVEVPKLFRGSSFAPGLLGEDKGTGFDPRRMVFLQRRLYETHEIDGFKVKGDKFGLRAGAWKYIEAEEEGTRELFDLQGDPKEAVNLAQKETARAERLSAAIRAWRTALGQHARAASDDSREAEEALRALGYVR